MNCQDARAEPADLEAISKTFRRWDAAIRAGDVATLLGLITEDAEFWTSSQPAVRGREVLGAAFEPLFARFDMVQDFDCRELIVSGDWAFVRGTENNRLTPKGEGDPIRRNQRAFSVLHRGEDGVWRFARGMTNRPPETGGDPGGGS
jgi:uncharacterized protein (TIGR02246 family)